MKVPSMAASTLQPGTLTPTVPTSATPCVIAENRNLDRFSAPPVRLVRPLTDHADMDKRVKLQRYNTFDDAVDLIRAASNIIVLTGAGISTSLGIPDFRSKGGLYELLAEDCEFDDPQELFRIDTFRDNPLRFYNLVAKRLAAPLGSDGNPRYSLTHVFIRLLQDQGKLLTNFTQNIDGLELVAGVSKDKLIQAHGSIATGSCLRCKKQYSKSFRAIWDKGQVPKCGRCTRELLAQEDARRRGNSSQGTAGSTMKRKREQVKKPCKKRKTRKEWEDASTDESDSPREEEPVLRPNITFFDETVPLAYDDRLEQDSTKADLLIIMGTSLTVQPLSNLPMEDSVRNIPQIYISKKPLTGRIQPDIQLLGLCDVIVRELARRLGWELKDEMLDAEKENLSTVKIEAMEGARGQYLVMQKPQKQAKKQ